MRSSVTAVLAAMWSSLRTRAELQAEILALRHQLAVLQRAAPRRLQLRRADRLFWVLLSRVWRGWRGAVQIVQTATVVAWHRRHTSVVTLQGYLDQHNIAKTRRASAALVAKTLTESV